MKTRLNDYLYFCLLLFSVIAATIKMAEYYYIGWFGMLSIMTIIDFVLVFLLVQQVVHMCVEWRSKS